MTEPAVGTDTTSIRTFALRDGDVYRISGQEIGIARAQHSDLMALLARTMPCDQVVKRSG